MLFEYPYFLYFCLANCQILPYKDPPDIWDEHGPTYSSKSLLFMGLILVSMRTLKDNNSSLNSHIEGKCRTVR